ncbi:F-box/lrr-repeat protein 13, partial [Globisporangium splendens]
MGAEISTFLAQDAAQSVNGVLCEQQLVPADSSSAGGFRRTANDVAQREQLFAFCADWDIARVGQFLRWYARFAKKALPENSAALASQLSCIHSQVDRVEHDVETLQNLLEQLDLELAAIAALPSEQAEAGGDNDDNADAASPQIYPSTATLQVFSELHARRHGAEQMLRQKVQELRELKQHLLASIEDVDRSAIVRWPLFLSSITKVHLQATVTAHADVSTHRHPASTGYAMVRDSRAARQMTDYNKGDILLPPLENHEIDGFTDDSASSSAASAEESDADAESDNQDEDRKSENGDGGSALDGDAADTKRDANKRRAAGTGSDDGEDDEEDDEDDDKNNGNGGAPVQPIGSSSDEFTPGETHPTALTLAALAEHETQSGDSEKPDSKAAKAPEISYQDALKRPRVIKRVVPDSFDATSRSPVFFGYSLEKQTDGVAEVGDEEAALELKENITFQQKLEHRKSKLESTLVSERGKLQVKREAEFERAKKELDPNDVFFRTHEVQDKRTRDQEAHENEELRRQKSNIEARMKTAQDDYDQVVAKVDEIRSKEYPLGDTRMLFHDAEMDRYQIDISEAKQALVTAKEEYVALKTSKLVNIPSQEGKQRAQLLVAEDQIRAREKDVEAVCVFLENELFLHKRAQEIYEKEKLFLHFFTCLNGGECKPHAATSFSLLDATIALLVGIGESRVEDKMKFIFSMFARKSHGGKQSSIPILPRESFAEILRVLFNLFAKIGDFHPPRGLTTEYLLGLAERECLKLEISGLEDEASGAGSSGMTCFEFEQYCIGVIEKSKYLCSLVQYPWKYEQLSRYVIQHMSATHRYKLGLININDLKYTVARGAIQLREELSRWKKNLMHERALAMGENDTLKTDYSKYLPKRRTKLLSNVVPLDHGGYRNLLNYRVEVILRSTVKLQTIWRAKKGRQIARLAAEKQAFYHARGVALEEARVTIENEWKGKDAKPAHSVEKMKFEAKIRTKQVKLRTKGNAFNREQVLALMMEEAVQQAQREVENRFREMEEELGYLKHEDSLQLSHTEMGYLKEEISEALVVQLFQAKQESAQVSNMLDMISANKEKAKEKARLKKAKKKKANQQNEAGGAVEVPETEAPEEVEQHLVDVEGKASRDLLVATRKENMVFGRFPSHLYQSGFTKDEQATQMAFAFPDPPLSMLQRRLQQVCVGMTEFKMMEFLQELPSKRHICAYVDAFRLFDGSYDMNRIERDLYEHFRMVRGSEQLAEALVNVAESDLECGLSRKLLHTIQGENDQVLTQLVANQSEKIATENAAIIAKRLARMGYKASVDKDQTSGKSEGYNALIISPTALLVQKEQYDMAECKKTKWAERFHYALRLPEGDADQIREKYTETLSVCQDFIETATSIALVLVRELYLPLREKSILPTASANIDGRSGDIRSTRRLKYEAHDILFKICTGDHGRFECSHEFSAKYGSHEIRNSALYLRALSHHENVILPLECCVDFQGFRVVCSSKIPIEIMSWDESGASIQKISKQLVLGSDNRGKTITFQSKELDTILADAAVRLNLSRHGVKGYQDLTSKSVHAPADMLGYVDAKKKFVVLNFARAMPPEDPEMTPHLNQSSRGMSIMWRQLRPEFVNAYHTPLSPDALSCMTYCTPDWQAQSLGVEEATLHLLSDVIPQFAKKLSQKLRFFTASSFDITAEMHRHGINVRHLGLLRSNFLFALSGTATLQYSTAEIQTTADFTREIERGSHIYVNGKMCEVSRNMKDRFDASCITLTLIHKGDSIQNVTVYGGRLDCKQHSTEIRALLLAEMVTRAFKNIVRHMMRAAAKLSGTVISPHLFKEILTQFLNLLSGARRGSEDFWRGQLYEGILVRFGLRAVSEVDRQNMRRNLLSHTHYVVRRTTEMLGVKLTPKCFDRLEQHPDCYTFTAEDLAVPGDQYRVKHNMSMLHFSMASLLLLHATVKQATSYKQLLLSDGPCGYWTLCERRGLPTAVNLGKYGDKLSGRYMPGCTLEAPGPIVNIDLNRPVQLKKEARSYVGFPYVPSLYPADAESHMSLEVWCKCDGHESTRRVVLTMGRFALSALKANVWAFSINVKNIDIIAFGSQVELHKWTYLVGTYDGTMLRLYVNGFLQNEVEVESVVDSEIEKREAVIKKTREDIDDRENEAKGQCFKEVDREMQQFFVSKERKKQIKTISQKLLDEHAFRVRLSKNTASAAQGDSPSPTKPVPPTIDSGAPPLKKDASKVSRSDFEPLAKKQLFREKFDTQWLIAAAEFKEMRRDVNMKIRKELEEQSNQDMRELRIGCLSSVRRRDGKYFFHGNIAHVAYYNNQVLTRDQVNAHYVMAVRDRAHESDYLFSLASSRFSRALAFAQDDKKTLEKFAENICASLKYDLDHQHAQELYKKKVKCGLEPFSITENVHRIAEILKNLPRDPAFADLFIYCFKCLMRICPQYFQAIESLQCRLSLRELGRMPFQFFLGSRSANSLVNIADGNDPQETEEEEAISVFADIICKVLREYPMFYGDQLTNMGWLRALRSTKAVVYFILAIEAGEDVRLITLKDIPDVTNGDMDVIAKNNRFCCSFQLARCSLLSDVSMLRISLCCTQLESLDISHLGSVTDAALLGIGKNCHRLKRLWMTNCHQISDIGVEAVVRGNPKLEELGLSFCEKISDRCFPAIVKSCPDLSVLEAELCMQLGNSAMKHLAAGLATSNKLRRLNIAGCRRISDEGLVKVAKCCTRLKEVNVRLCDKLTDLSVRMVAHNCLELEVLNMEEIYAASYKIFVFDQEGDGRGVVEKNLVAKLKVINLTGCSGLTDLALGHLFHRAKKLKSITLSSCAGISDHGLTWMLEDMLDHSRCGECLEHVDFSYCPQLSATAIRALVVRCPNLTSLNLSGCVHLTGENLVDAINACEKLVRLEVGFCRELSDLVLSSIAKQLSLEELNLARCVKITDSGMLEIAAQFIVLKKLNVFACKKLTGATLEALYEGCTMLEEMDVAHCPQFPADILAKFVQRKVKLINRRLGEIAVNRAVVELDKLDAKKDEDGDLDEREEVDGDDAWVPGSHDSLGKKILEKPAITKKSAKSTGSLNNLPSIYKRHHEDSI